MTNNKSKDILKLITEYNDLMMEKIKLMEFLICDCNPIMNSKGIKCDECKNFINHIKYYKENNNSKNISKIDILKQEIIYLKKLGKDNKKYRTFRDFFMYVLD